MASRLVLPRWRGCRMEKMKTKDIPRVKAEIIKEQGYQCLLCRMDLRKVEARNVCLDHCHKSGYVRGVLCRNCNGILGKVENLATRAKKDITHLSWLENAVSFLQSHSKAPVYPYIHPTHKTENEKRVLRNKKARDRRPNAKSKT